MEESKKPKIDSSEPSTEDDIEKNTNILFLFDVDGTLSPSREVASPIIKNMLRELRRRVNIAFVGGSDLSKQKEQLGDDLLDIFDYGFPENGVQFYRNGQLEKSGSILEYLGEDSYKKIVNRILALLSEADAPRKRGTFIELRRSMINVSPVGRSCSKEERLEFFAYDTEHGVRRALCDTMNREFEEYKLQCVIGGQISIDIFPKGWDKTYSLQHVSEETIVFFGDMTSVGGNDYEIFSHERVKGNSVTGPESTFAKVNEELEGLGLRRIE